MFHSRWFLVLPALAAALVVTIPAGLAKRGNEQTYPRAATAAEQTSEIVQEFPGAGAEKTAWKVTYAAGSPRPGLMITGTWFKTGPREEWFQVAGEIRLSEIFVPYNDGVTRLYDISAQGNYDLIKHTAADAGANGKLLHGDLVVKEVRDTGVLWKYYDQVRRGQELVLWATISASNYNYLIEYAFRCDGSMQCRMGSTGKVLSNHETTGHMHHACWRIDLNVGEKDHNNVAVVRWHEPPADMGKAEDQITYLKTEGGVAWKADEFTRLRVESRLKNSQGKKIAYDVAPQRPGTPRHFGPDEEFTSHDFWVTPYKFNELYYINLPQYTKQGRSVADTDVVIWYMSPAYHLPRDEDGIFINPEGRMQVRGVALTTWCGIEMRPRNLFDKTPLYP
jgi:Cu2+-containing amine oxidase